MLGWHHRVRGCESEQTAETVDGCRSLACRRPGVTGDATQLVAKSSTIPSSGQSSSHRAARHWDCPLFNVTTFGGYRAVSWDFNFFLSLIAREGFWMFIGQPDPACLLTGCETLEQLPNLDPLSFSSKRKTATFGSQQYSTF